MNLKSILNKILARAHTKLEFDVIGIARKLVKKLSSLVQKNFIKKICFSSYKLAKLQLTSFWFQGILGVYP
jgi:hypothetical protein